MPYAAGQESAQAVTESARLSRVLGDYGPLPNEEMQMVARFRRFRLDEAAKFVFPFGAPLFLGICLRLWYPPNWWPFEVMRALTDAVIVADRGRTRRQHLPLCQLRQRLGPRDPGAKSPNTPTCQAGPAHQ